MALDDFLQAHPLQPGATPAAPEPAPTPTPGADPGATAPSMAAPPSFLEAKRTDYQDQLRLETRFQAWRASRSDVSPETAVEVLRLSAATGQDAEFVHRNLDTLRQQAQQGDLEAALETSPALRRQMGNAARAAALRDDIANASALEWWLTGRWHWRPKLETGPFGARIKDPLPELEAGPAWARAFMDGLREREFNKRAAAAWAGQSSPENEARIAELRPAQQRGAADYGADNILSRAFIGAFRNVAEAVEESIATIGGIAAGAGTASVTAGPEAAPVGGAVGGYAVGAAYDFFDNVGAVYDDLRQLKRQDGSRLVDDATAQRYAFAASAIGASITGGLALKAARMIPGAEQVITKLTRSTVVEALQDETVQRATRRFVRSWGEQALTGAAMMSVQAGVNAGAEEVATARAEGRDTDWSRVMDATVQGFKDGLVEMSLLAGWGPTHTYLQERGRALEIQANAARLQGLTETAVASKIMQRSPELAEETAREMAREAGALSTVYADVGGWTRYWQGKGLSPAEAAAEVIGDGGKAWAEAQETGELAIPAEKYLRIAKSADGAQLAPDLKTRPEDLTPRQLEERQKLLQRLTEKPKAGEGAPAEPASGARAELDAIQERMEKALVAAKRRAPVARELATVIREAVGALASLERKSPEQVLAENPITFSALQEAGPVPAGRAAQTQMPLPRLWGAFRTRLAELGVPEEGVRVVDVSGLRPPAPAPFKSLAQETEELRARRLADLDLQLGTATDPAEIEAIRAERQRIAEGSVLTVRSPFTGAQVAAEEARVVAESERAAAAGEIQVVDLFPGEHVALQLAQGGERGVIEFRVPGAPGEPVAMDVAFLAGADESTGIHEFGHYLALVLGQLATKPGASAEAQALYRTTLEHMGYASHEERLQQLRDRAGLEQRLAAGKGLSAEEEAFRRSVEVKEERFSTAFELFLAEGKAPSRELASVFARFKLWMRKIYRSLQGISAAYRARYGEDLVLSDPMRAVFRRLLTSGEAIEAADAEPSITAVLPGATDADRAAEASAKEARREAGERELERLLVDADREARSEHMRDERERLRAEVDAELDARPVYRALRYLREGVVPEDLAVPAELLGEDGKPRRLDRAELLARYDAAFVRSLPPQVTAREGGVPADEVARLLGFASGDELTRELQRAQSRERLVETTVQDRLEEIYGPALIDDPRALAEAALEASDTPKKVADIVTGMRILARHLVAELNPRFRAVDVDLLSRKAEELVAQGPLGEVHAAKYLRASWTNARRAVELAAAGRVAAAYDAREQQLWNHLMWRSARKAEERAEKVRKRVRRYQDDDVRAELGKVGGGYLERVDDVLGSVELGSASVAEVARRRAALEATGGDRKAAAAMVAWIEEQRALNRDAVVPERLLKALDRTRHWRELSLEELEEIGDTVANLAHLARTKDKLLGAKDRREKVRVLEEMRDRAIETFGLNPTIVDRNTIGFKKRAIRLLKKAEAGVIRAEELLLALDGGREDGPFHRYLYQPIADAHTRWQDLAERIQKPLVRELEALPDETKAYLAKHRFHVNGQTYTMEAALAVALNWGNLSNREKTVQGWTTNASLERQGIRPWQGAATGEEFLRQVDARPELWAFVQRIWGAFDGHHDAEGNLVVAGTPGAVSLWSEAAELERRLTGLAPKKIEASPFTRKLADGTELQLQGGYYPMVYDKRFSKAGAAAAEALAEGKFQLFDQGYERSITPHGHLVSRIESFHAPVELSLTGLYRHLSHATKDIAMREALIDAHSLITDQRFRDVIQVTAGEDALRVLDKWVRDVANDLVVPDGGEGIYLQALAKTRAGLTASIFVANAAQALQNLAGFGNVLGKVDAKYLWQGIQEVASSRVETIRWVQRKSGEMRHRTKTFDRDLKEGLQKLLGQGSSASRAKEIGLYALQATDLTVAYPTWIAAYRQALAGKVEGVDGDEAAAIRHADSTVRRALGSGATKDLPALMRSPQGKMITMFYGFASAQLNQLIGAGAQARVEWNDGQRARALRRITRIYFSIVGGAVLAELLVGRGASDYDDDGEVTAADWSKWIALRAVFAPFTLIPLVGTSLRSVESGRDATIAPYERLFTEAAKVTRGAWDLGKAFVEDDDVVSELERFGLTTARAASTAVPGGTQVRNTLSYWLDEDSTPTRDSFGQQVLGTLFGSQRDGRLSHAIWGEE